MANKREQETWSSEPFPFELDVDLCPECGHPASNHLAGLELGCTTTIGWEQCEEGLLLTAPVPVVGQSFFDHDQPVLEIPAFGKSPVLCPCLRGTV
jgi:hypothetical protein